MSRKISALLLALVLVFSVTLCASAAQSNAGLKLEAQHRGDEILVTVSVSGGQGITNGRIALSYDPEMVTLTDARALVPCGEASINRETEGVAVLAWVGSDLGAEEAILRLTFRASSLADQHFSAEALEAYIDETEVAVASGETTLPVNPFVDIANHWAKDYILDAYHMGLFNGMTPNTFVPEGTMTRAMFVTTLYRMAGEPLVEKMADFTDVKENEYYTNAVSWAVEVGVTNGMGNGLFMPAKPINRQEMATMLYRYAEAEGKDVTAGAELADFVDAAQVSDWAEEAMAWAIGEGIIEGYPGAYLKPATNATRAQAATILCRYLGD